jgi:hypothetical protein
MKRLLALLLFSSLALADATNNGANNINQTSTSGSQTSISGGYSQESTTTYQSGSSSNTTSNSTTNNNNNTETAVNSAHAPAMSVYSQDSCSLVISGGITVMGVSFSGGGYVKTDEACERLKKAKMLNALGMKVASISIMCDDPLVFDAMYRSSTPCPVLTEDGRSVIGEEAMKIIFERRKPTDDKVEQYRRYKESLTNNGNNPK